MDNITTAHTIHMLQDIVQDADTPRAFTAAFGTGVLLHVLAFSRGEWDMTTTRIVSGIALGFAAIAAGLVYLQTGGLSSSGLAPPFQTSLALVAWAMAGVYASILFYRAFFHRLNRFPGPFGARLSNLWITRKQFKALRLFEEVQVLHRTYGDVVRLGPSELSIIDPQAVAAIHSNQSPCSKGPWYNILRPTISMHTSRSRQDHTQRRRTWDRGFSVKALHDYEPRVARYTTELLDQIEARVGQLFDATEWFNFYSFDVMGDLAFGKSFGMLQAGVPHYVMKSLHGDMKSLGQFGHMLWLFPLFKATPILNATNKRFWEFVRVQVEERMRNKPDRPDVFSWVLEDFRANPKPTWQDMQNLYGDAHLIIVAGSDTTAIALTCLFFELACHPEAFQKLRDEVDTYYAQNNKPEFVSLSKLVYMQACVDEALRLHPAVPSGVQRLTPPEGLQIGDTFVPGDTIVQIPTYTINRDERFFPHPDDFIPERWTTQPDLVKDASIFVPFSTGRYSCVGKQLALMEIRYVTSQVVHKYDISLAPGQTPEAFLEGHRDAFTLTLPPLNTIFRHRA